MLESGEECEDLARRLGVSFARTSALLAAAVPSIGERERIDALLRESGA